MTGQERRDLILERAKDVFAQHSYAGSSTALLAEASEVSEPMLYKHFGSKKGLFLAVVEKYVSAALDTWQARVDDLAQADRMNALSSLTYEYWMAMSDPQISALLLQAMAASFDDQELGQVIFEYQGRLIDVVYRLLDRAREEGLLPASLPLAAAAWGFVSNLIIIQFNRMAQPRPEDLPVEMQEFGRQMVRGSIDLWLYAIRNYPG